MTKEFVGNDVQEIQCIDTVPAVIQLTFQAHQKLQKNAKKIPTVVRAGLAAYHAITNNSDKQEIFLTTETTNFFLFIFKNFIDFVLIA